VADKLTDVAHAAGLVPSGATVGMGGMLLSRRPVELCRALGKSGTRDLTIVGVSGGFETDALIGLGIVREVRISFLSLGVFGLAPLFSKAVRDGSLSMPFETEMSIAAGLRAAAAGLSFQPARAWDGTQYGGRRPDVATVACPYTGERYVAFPRIDLDVALIHSPYADPRGNAVLLSDHVLDREMARTADVTVLSAERIVSTDDLRAKGSFDVIAADVDAVVEAPLGAWPGACLPDYDIDGAFLLEYVDRCKAGEADVILDQWLVGAIGTSEPTPARGAASVASSPTTS
jgi:glutaconate CoA-transferase, subunit A